MNLLSKVEMKNVMGGVISPEVWHQMCLERAEEFTDPNPHVQMMMRDLLKNDCDRTYAFMPGREN